MPRKTDPHAAQRALVTRPPWPHAAGSSAEAGDERGSRPVLPPPGAHADTVGTRYMRRIIASLAAEPGPPAGRGDPDREAGS